MMCQSMNCCIERIDTVQSGSGGFESASLLKQLIGRSDWTKQQCRSSQPRRLVVCSNIIESMPLSEQLVSLKFGPKLFRPLHWSVLK